MADKRLEIRNVNDKQVTVSAKGIEIRHQGKPISGMPRVARYVFLLLDRSGSMAANGKFSGARKGALAFARDALAIDYAVGLIGFDSKADLILNPVNTIETLQSAVGQMQLGSETHMGEAINLAHRSLRFLQGTRAIVLVTDGVPNGKGDPESTKRAARMAKEDGIDIITIGTDDADEQFLKSLASRTQLGVKVESAYLESTITDAAKLLPSGNNK